MTGPIMREAIRTALSGPRATSIVMHPETFEELKAEAVEERVSNPDGPQWVHSPTSPKPFLTGPTPTHMVCGKSVVRSMDVPHGVFLLAGHVDPVWVPAPPEPVTWWRRIFKGKR